MDKKRKNSACIDRGLLAPSYWQSMPSMDYLEYIMGGSKDSFACGGT